MTENLKPFVTKYKNINHAVPFVRFSVPHAAAAQWEETHPTLLVSSTLVAAVGSDLHSRDEVSQEGVPSLFYLKQNLWPT